MSRFVANVDGVLMLVIDGLRFPIEEGLLLTLGVWCEWLPLRQWLIDPTSTRQTIVLMSTITGLVFHLDTTRLSVRHVIEQGSNFIIRDWEPT